MTQTAPPFTLRLSSLKEEGVLQVSKWIKSQVLLDSQEMSELLQLLEPLYFCLVSEPVLRNQALLSSDAFLELYTAYVETLKQGQLPDDALFRRTFSSAMTASLDLVYGIAVGKDRLLVKPVKPVIQLQAHQFFYSETDKKFHPMVLGKESITWGIQFSYPQLYQDPKTHQIVKVTDGLEFPNTPLFSKLSKWLRHHTVPTPFVVQGERLNVPIRIGHSCFPWIHKHPQLRGKKIEVFSFPSENSHAY